ncbi:NAD-dependent succinate-semialdehyde dehydrogenase [Erythrobacter neustonensis]|uniref:NAD-dependent succinate-semialdehyde dehydrogenase n=1 Tax=Erythrobacter neustonensis TaxID=1112 RepID=A0A192D0R4_9SPHN|nr:NAD-dependent succinate-semialdehyde dehydrogenase [Erythrobacter neustonensis]ANK11740.1 NAD-dependent succinate-semialdehyde dehydrogenase [Erythrobacter neustonensis]
MTAYPTLKLFIAGQWTATGEAGSMDVINPATGDVIGQCPKASTGQLDAALKAAGDAFPRWSATPGAERYAILRRAADLLRERAPVIAKVVTAEMGKPHAQAVGEIAGSADVIDFLGEEAKRRGGRMIPVRGGQLIAQMVTHEPIGPAVLLTPWNFPVNLPAKKIAGALAAGCTAIFKPAENTPASAQLLVECFVDAGVPEGVLNLVHGDPGPIAEHLIASPVTRKVSFTGSTAIGKQLGALAATHMKRFAPELGGHAPVIVSKNADIARAAAMCAATKFRNAGQVCVSPTRFLVAREVYDQFVADFAERASRIKVGDAGIDDSVEMGPLAHARRISAMEQVVADTGGNRGEVVTGGKAMGGRGFFFPPTVIANPAPDSRFMTEEPFGPIAGIVPFDTIENAVGIANGLRYGLAAYAFSADLDEAHYLGRALRAGMVGINQLIVSSPETPFGGVGDSGFGSEGGEEGYLAFTDTKLVMLAKAGG